MELEGKIINFLGDSITEGVGVNGREDNRFTTLICKKCNCKRVNNYGVGGTRIAHQITPSEKARHDMDFCGRCWDMDKEADIVVVFGGVNDYFHGDAPIGKDGQTHRTTFYGALDYLCRTIKELHPNATYVFLAPAHCINDDRPSQSDKKPAFAERRMLTEYIEAIKTVATRYGFHYWSMYDELGIDPKNPEEREKYTADGIHFNNLGHEKLAEKIISLLQSI